MVILLPLIQFDHLLVLDEVILIMTMVETISMKISVKASESKTLGKPPPGDITFGIDPEIHFYAIEDGDDTEEVEESEIIVIYDSSLATYKKNLVNRKSPFIDILNHEELTVISAMHDLTVRVFDHLNITYPMDV